MLGGGVRDKEKCRNTHVSRCMRPPLPPLSAVVYFCVVLAPSRCPSRPFGTLYPPAVPSISTSQSPQTGLQT